MNINAVLSHLQVTTKTMFDQSLDIPPWGRFYNQLGYFLSSKQSTICKTKKSRNNKWGTITWMTKYPNVFHTNNKVLMFIFAWTQNLWFLLELKPPEWFMIHETFSTIDLMGINFTVV